MGYADLFVAGVATVIGGAIIVAAILDAEWCQRYRLSRMAARAWGRTGARAMCAVLGLVLMGLGGLIAFRVQPPWTW